MRNRSACARVLALSICAAMFATPAIAEKGGNGKGGGKGSSHSSGKSHGNSGSHGGGGHGNSAAGGKGKPKKFETSARSDIQRYYHEEFERSGNCPRGLAKKNNGCMPPGQARRAWNVGSVIPHDVYIEPLPPALYGTLVAPMPGYTYGYVDGDVILYGVSDHVVIDFVAVF